MTEDRTEQPLLRHFGADSAMQGFLKDSLRRIRELTDDDTIRTSVDGVLSGRRSLYDIFGDEEFVAAATPAIEHGIDAFLEMDEETREALVAEGSRFFDQPGHASGASDPS
jgi:hypothetical protein